ncbi:glycosyltransferase family 2 protein [Roseovarius sp. Pro17]|uniref:glycosyltransferase family 2 protein n=1 Tax=Roseovarius sp. Pro17 TaxID=3108175 RepID=UPI002D77EA66|nr:glycosyltransferase family 2 protein [Roseovarius sp. Pro17]
MSEARARITIVTVAYNSAAVLPDMLASVPAGVPVAIVDNASRDLAELRALAATDGVTLIENAKNEGFGRGCNRGAEAARTEFVLFLNPDTVLLPTTLTDLLTAADAHPDASAFNPRILDESGRAILKRRSDLVARRDWLPKGELSQDTLVPVLSGAALMVRKADFDAVGGFDPKIFLFFEDDDLSIRLAQSCGPLIFVHAASVQHVGGASSHPSREGERLKNWHWGWSQIYTTTKHRGRAACVAAYAKTGLRALSPATLASAQRRRKYAARLSGMIAALIGSGKDDFRG